MDVGVVRNRDGGVCRERSGFATIAQRFTRRAQPLCGRGAGTKARTLSPETVDVTSRLRVAEALLFVML